MVLHVPASWMVDLLKYVRFTLQTVFRFFFFQVKKILNCCSFEHESSINARMWFKKRLEAKRDCIASILLFKRIAVYAHYTWWNFRRCDILEKSNAARHLWMFFSHFKSSYFQLHFAHNMKLLIKWLCTELSNNLNDERR